MHLMKRMKRLLFITPARTIFTIYLATTLIGGFLLWLPIAHNPGVELSFFDSLFISLSQLSSTGLSPVSQRDTFNLFGGIVSIVIIQIGGLGIVMMVAAYWVIIGKKIGLKERNLIASEQNQFTVKGIIKLVVNAVTAILIFQVIYIIFMIIYIVTVKPFPVDNSIGEAVFQAFYLAASAFGNAGFDFLPLNQSFAVFTGHYPVIIATMLLIFTGGVGFWPLAEFMLWIKAKIKGKPYKWTFISKLLIISHLIFWLGSALLYFIMEYQHSMVGINTMDVIMNVLFMTSNSRSAGFSIIDVTKWAEATRLVFAMLMFIGAAPNSSGGGIRMTTFFLVAAGLFSFGRHRKQVFFAGHAMKDSAVRKSFMVFALAIVLVMLSTLMISIIEPNVWTIMDIGFEVSSAFGTVGLSMGLVPTLSVWSKFILMINMFVGRIGILTAVAMLENKKETTNVVTYVEMDMLVG